MNNKLLKSITSLAIVVALGAGATYAAFTSNTVTITSSQVTSGNANIKLCNADGDNDWKNIINPSLSTAGLVPGGPEKELTHNTLIYIGNDGGLLDNQLGSVCNNYASSAENSDIPMKLLPKVTPIACDTGLTHDDFELKFQVGQQTTGFHTLNGWAGNSSVFLAPTFDPNDVEQVQVFARLASGVTQKGATCTFDITFEGHQI